MPKSKKAKVVPLTKVKRRPRSAKEAFIEEIRQTVGKFSNVFVFEVENQRTAHIQTIRGLLLPGRMFFGKRTVMQVALGTTMETEVAPNMHKISKELVGNRGIIVTNNSREKIERIFASNQPQEYARAGSISTLTLVLQEGTKSLSQFPHSMEPQLRNLGLPTVLKGSVIHLMGDVTVATKGEKLSVQAAHLLKLLGIQSTTFHMRLVAAWKQTTDGGVIERFEA